MHWRICGQLPSAARRSCRSREPRTPMSISLRCPYSRAKVAARPSATGKAIRCASCDRKFTPPDDEDDIEEAPRPRKRPDEDEEVAPPRKPKVRKVKRKKKRRGLPKFALPVVGLALLIVAGGVLYKYVVRPWVRDAQDAGGNPVAAEHQIPEADLLAWVPADSSQVSFVNHRALAYCQATGNGTYRHSVLV